MHLQKHNKANWKFAKGKLKVLGNNWQQLGAAAAHLIARRCHRDVMVSLSLPVPRKTDRKQHLKKEKLDILILFFWASFFTVLPPFIKVSKNKTLAEPGMWRMTRGAQELQLHHSTSIPSFSAQLLLTGNHTTRLRTRVLYTIPPNTADHPQPNPPQIPIFSPTSSKITLVLSQQAGRPG